MEHIVNILLLPIAFFVGRFTEGRHIKRLGEREKVLGYIHQSNLKRVVDPTSVCSAELVIGHVVIATDYWKSFATKLRNLVGGEMRSAQSLMIRGRREAVVRMLQDAQTHGATEVWNIRFGFSNIAMMRNNTGAMQVEIYAYGTAVKR
jgi:uncharacterized protein YbjQ (UPF0145 family)